jgi:WD40 repeat protein
LLPGDSRAVFRLAQSTDGEVLTSSTEDGTVWLWDVRSGRPLASLLGHAGAVYSAPLSADRHLLAGGSLDGPVRCGRRMPERWRQLCVLPMRSA